MLARVPPFKVRFWVALISFLAFFEAGQELLMAQTQGASASTSQATLNRPSLSTPKQALPKVPHQHATHRVRVEANQTGSSAKPSPVNPDHTARANLSTIGPGGYSNVLQPFLGGADWVGNPFLPPAPQANIRPPWAAGRNRRNDGLLAVPVYIPYAPGMYDDEGNPDSAEEDAQFSDAEDMNDEGMPEDASEQMAPEVERDPVVSQPATVIVFKDGHRADVVNYAIVGDTLFDFADGLTRKIQLATIDLTATQRANEAIGVEFKLPPASSR